MLGGLGQNVLSAKWIRVPGASFPTLAEWKLAAVV